jgi:hypothetical protein
MRFFAQLAWHSFGPMLYVVLAHLSRPKRGSKNANRYSAYVRTENRLWAVAILVSIVTYRRRFGAVLRFYP